MHALYILSYRYNFIPYQKACNSQNLKLIQYKKYINKDLSVYKISKSNRYQILLERNVLD